jgi:hypothetical protein
MPTLYKEKMIASLFSQISVNSVPSDGVPRPWGVRGNAAV